MSNARDNIIRRLRARQPAANPAAAQTTLSLPSWAGEERIGQFRKVLESVRAEVHVIPAGQWTDKLKALVKAKQMNNLLYAPQGPLGESIRNSWAGEGLPPLLSRDAPVDEWKEELFFGIDGAVTSARAGIAETGTLVLWPTPEEPRSWSLVPPVHFVVLDAANLHNTFAELIAQEQWHRGLPTNVLLISGPSKSADIEQTLAYGVHGPVELVVLVRT